jgi:hypothetical protein
MEIRPSKAEEAPALSQLYHHINPEFPGDLDPDIRCESETLVAQVNGEPVGLALISFVDYGVNSFADIHELTVIPNLPESDQIRDSLVESCLRWAAEHGAIGIYATVDDNDERFLLGSLGFRTSRRTMFSVRLGPYAPEQAEA